MKALYFCFLLLTTSVLPAQKPGTLDKTFARSGRQWDTVGRYASYPALLVQPDDKILTGGRGFLKGNGTKTFRIDRLLKEGSADNTFGVKGTVLVNFHFVQNKDGYIADLTALALQADGKILACSTYIKNYYD